MAYVWVLTWGWGHCREYEDTPQNMVEAASRLKTFTLVPAVGKPSPPIPLHFTPRLQICFINSAISPKNRQGASWGRVRNCLGPGLDQMSGG